MLPRGSLKRMCRHVTISLVRLSCLCWIVAIPLVCGIAAAENFEGQKIARIVFEPAQQPVDFKDLGPDLAVHRGGAYRLEDVRATIKRLFTTGRYQDIQAQVEPSPDGLVLKFVTTNNWFIGHVSVEGKLGEPPNTAQLVNASRLELGKPFAVDQIKAAEDSMTKLLVANGYYESSIQHRFDYDDSAQQVNITFVLTSGKRARFTDPKLSGTLDLSPAAIVRATHWHRFLIPGWHLVRQRGVQTGLENVRVKYRKQDRLLATVQLTGMDYDPKTVRAKPSLQIEAGPKVAVKTIGQKFSRKKLEANVPIYEEHAVDRDLLVEGARNLRDELQAAGFFDATVDFQEQRVINDRQEIDYLITPGTRHRFVHLDIEGNHYFKQEDIRERMFLETKSFQFRHGRFSEAFVRRDQETLTNLYRSNGFRDVAVTHVTKDDYQGREGDIAVTIHIEEGVQWLVSDLHVTGYKRLDLKNVLSTLSSSTQQPYADLNVASDRDSILAYYFENGFPNATFEWSSTPGPAPHTVNLKYQVTEGEQQFVRQVQVNGLNVTRPRLVYRNLQLNPGDPLSPLKMADTQKRLYDLGVFASVDTAVQNPEGAEHDRFVLFDMEEGSRYSVSGGIGATLARIGGSNQQADLTNPGGATGVSPRVSLDVSRINFLGLGHTVSLRTRYSTLEKRGLFDYLAPRILNHTNLDLSFDVLYDDSRDVRTFSAKRAEVSTQLTDRLTKALTAFFRFSYRHVNVGTLKIDPLLIPRLSQSDRVGMFSANFVEDRRDDPTDAHKGRYNTLDLGYSSSIFGSQVSFLRLLARNASYHRVTRKLLLARELSIGIAPAFGGIVEVSTDPDPIPLPERFFAGGGETMRGFPENQAGPRDKKTGFPLGGSALLFHKTELRFPLIGENIGGVLFHDMGNVYSTPGNISFRVHQKSLTDFDYMVHAVGFGIRYRTPIGPVRGDVAYSINPPSFNGFKGTFNQLLQCTETNSCTSARQQISHFQFFFSIGQTF